jgi:hypothetical protein
MRAEHLQLNLGIQAGFSMVGAGFVHDQVADLA